jgi:hypothetical protein
LSALCTAASSSVMLTLCQYGSSFVDPKSPYGQSLKWPTPICTSGISDRIAGTIVPARLVATFSIAEFIDPVVSIMK